MSHSPYENRPALTPETAARWAPACTEYFQSYQNGVFDAASYIQVVLPVQDIYESKDHPDLVIGYAGVDGIYFCFREGQAGLWAFYGMEDRHSLLAPSIEAFLTGWHAGKITL